MTQAPAVAAVKRTAEERSTTIADSIVVNIVLPVRPISSLSASSSPYDDPLSYKDSISNGAGPLALPMIDSSDSISNILDLVSDSARSNPDLLSVPSDNGELSMSSADMEDDSHRQTSNNNNIPAEVWKLQRGQLQGLVLNPTYTPSGWRDLPGVEEGEAQTAQRPDTSLPSDDNFDSISLELNEMVSEEQEESTDRGMCEQLQLC